MESDPLSGMFGVFSPRLKVVRAAPQPTEATWKYLL